VVWPHHTNTTLFEKSCGVGVVWLWCWCGVGVVSVWFGRRLSVVCHRTGDIPHQRFMDPPLGRMHTGPALWGPKFATHFFKQSSVYIRINLEIHSLNYENRNKFFLKSPVLVSLEITRNFWLQLVWQTLGLLGIQTDLGAIRLWQWPPSGLSIGLAPSRQRFLPHKNGTHPFCLFYFCLISTPLNSSEPITKKMNDVFINVW